MAQRLLLTLFLTVALATFLSCGPPKIERNVSSSIGGVNGHSEYLKAHMKDGSLYVLHNWSFDSVGVWGTGSHLDQNRNPIEEGSLHVPKSSVALFETNSLNTSAASIGLAILSVAHAALTIYCIANPKACFGSCPTFYTQDSSGEHLVAEGFSSSILPSEEAVDIDALPHVHPRPGPFSITMKNEALETHVVRSVELLAAPHAPGNRVFQTDDAKFYEASKLISPASCIGAEGSAQYEVASLDGVERRSLSDSTDLAKKETLDLTFDAEQSGSFGLVLGVRQTFVTTYLFYQTLSYLGQQAGTYLAHAESGDGVTLAQMEKARALLGGIEVWNEETPGKWVKAGEVYEAGPIATDVHLLRFAGLTKPHHVRLRMAQGSWRIDWIALAKLEGEVTPIVIQPTGTEHTAKQIMLQEDGNASAQFQPGTIVTQPGDEYRFTYNVPKAADGAEFFLRSRGYYLEWMREDWLREENPIKAALMLLDPASAMKQEAPRFKAIEQEMEVGFWKSKIAHLVQ